MNIRILCSEWSRDSDIIIVSSRRDSLVKPHLVWWEVNMAVVVVVFNEMPDYSEDITSSLAPSKPGESRKRGYKMLNQNVFEKCLQRQL